MPFLFVSSLGRADFADCHEIDNHFEDVKIRQLYTIDPIANDSPPLKGKAIVDKEFYGIQSIIGTNRIK